MKYFFDDPEKVRVLRKSLEEWVGTPWRHWCGVKQGGTDCTHFTRRILIDIGALPESAVKMPWYPRDWHLHRSEELLLNGVTQSGWFEEVDLNDPHDGDLILFRVGRVHSHSAIFCDGGIYHSLVNIGVRKTSWEDTPKHFDRRFSFRVLTCQMPVK